MLRLFSFFLLFFVFVGHAWAGSTMTKDEWYALGEEVLKPFFDAQLEECDSIGDSSSQGIKFTRIGCRVLRRNPYKDENVLAAKALFEKSAELNEPYAQYYLSFYYLKYERPKGLALLRQAANAGVVEAQLKLVSELVVEDEAKALSWCEKAAATGDKMAKFQLGFFLATMGKTEEDKRRGCNILTTLAKEGLFQAQQVLLSMGDLVCDSQMQALLNCLSSGAEAGNAKFYTAVGMIYEDGVGVEQDKDKAFHWYMRATKAGDRFGYLQLGSLLFPGSDNTGME